MAFPTETVYGLGADATSDSAVQKIFDVKNRPTINPLIVHIADFEAISDVADLSSDPRAAQRLAKLRHFWPGPLSVVLPRKVSISSLTSAGLPTVAVRVPNHPIALELLRAAGVPIAAPSANPSSYVSPTSASHVEKGLGGRIDMILDGGSSAVGIESTIVSLIGEHPTLLRPGFVTFEQLQQILPDLQERTEHSADQPVLSPGLLREHYAPATRIALRSELSVTEYPKRVGLIAFDQSGASRDDFAYAAVSVLSQHGQLTEIAAKLFAAIRAQDEMRLDLIVVDSCPAVGLGRAIMDRLLRATAKFS